MELLSEARKYRMGLVLATQYTAQITSPFNPNNLFSAIMGNVGAIVTFRLGYEDALKIAPLLHPQFTSPDISGLPNWCGYSRLQTTSETLPPISFKIEKEPDSYDHETKKRIEALSRRKYGMDAEIVDQQIHHRRTCWKKSADGD